MSDWLVTGGAGFIGSNFVSLAAARTAARLVVLDALTYAGNLANIAELIEDGRIRFVRGDICDSACLAALFRDYSFDRIIHFAAESHVDRSILGAQAFIRTNIDGTYRLLEAARAAWAGTTRDNLFLHVSTDEVFGALGPADAPFTEASPYRPSSPYAASKAAADHMVRAWQRTYGLPAVVTNSSNNYGPRQFPEKLIPLMTLNAIEGRELPVYGNGQQVRDWLHVEDHCEALLLILSQGVPGQTYAISSGDERPNIEVVLQICRTVDGIMSREPGTSERLIRHVADRPGHDRRYALDAHKLRSELGWRPRRLFSREIASVVAWYLANRDWADAIRSGEYMDYYRRQYDARPAALAQPRAAAAGR